MRSVRSVLVKLPLKALMGLANFDACNSISERHLTNSMYERLAIRSVSVARAENFDLHALVETHSPNLHSACHYHCTSIGGVRNNLLTFVICC